MVLQEKALSTRKEADMKIQVVPLWLLIFTMAICSYTIDINQPSAPAPTGNLTSQTTNARAFSK